MTARWVLDGAGSGAYQSLEVVGQLGASGVARVHGDVDRKLGVHVDVRVLEDACAARRGS